MSENKLKIEYIQEFAKQYDFEVLNFYRINNKPYVTVKCKNGHIHDLTWHCFKAKHGCKECNRKHTKEDIITFANNYNYKIKSFENFSDLNSKIIFICSNGHELLTSFSNFKNGRRCPCEGGVNYYTQAELKNIFKENGCILLSEYTIQKNVVDFQCDCGNISKIRVDHFLSGVRCDKCAKIKRRKTLYKNNTAPCSKQQRYICNLFNGKLNYPIKNRSLDVAFPNERIYIECDFGGHNLCVKKGLITQEEFDKKEIQRSVILRRLGWKEIRIISCKDNLPSDEILIQMLHYAKQYILTGHSWINFDIDNNRVITSQYVTSYNYGKLRKITKKDLENKSA